MPEDWSQEMKACPFCGETIIAIAKKCRFCGEFLDGTAAPVNPVSARLPSEPKGGVKGSNERFCHECAEVIRMAAEICPMCGVRQAPLLAPTVYAEPPGHATVRSIASYEKTSAIFWLILAILQIISVYAAIAGVWNLVASWTRFRMVKRIRAREAGVPREYEGVAGLIIIGLVNLFLGGVIGVIFVAFDFYVRSRVLNNRALFNCHPVQVVAPPAA